MVGVEMEIQKPGRLDQIGIALSGACAVHCVLTPLLLILMPLVGAALASPWVHRVFAFVLIPPGMFAFLRGYARSGKLRAMLVGGGGMTVLVWSLMLSDQNCCANGVSWTHTLINVAASLVIIVGHGLNVIDSRGVHCCDQSTSTSAVKCQC
jgi:hypothetical protein